MEDRASVLASGQPDAGNRARVGIQPVIVLELLLADMKSDELSKAIHKLYLKALTQIPTGGQLCSVASPVCLPVGIATEPQAGKTIWFVSLTIGYHDAAGPEHPQIVPSGVEQFIDEASLAGARIDVEPPADIADVIGRLSAMGATNQRIDAGQLAAAVGAGRTVNGSHSPAGREFLRGLLNDGILPVSSILPTGPSGDLARQPVVPSVTSIRKVEIKATGVDTVAGDVGLPAADRTRHRYPSLDDLS